MNCIGHDFAVKVEVDESIGTCQRCGATKVELHIIVVFRPNNTGSVDTLYIVICEDGCYKEWSTIFEQEVQRSQDKHLFYYRFMRFMKNEETVKLT